MEKEPKFIGTPKQAKEAAEVLDRTLEMLIDTVTPETDPLKCSEIVRELFAIQRFKDQMITETIFNYIRREKYETI